MTLAIPSRHDEAGATSPIMELAERAGVWRLSLEQYREMVRAGIIGEDDDVELLRGVIVKKDRGVAGKGSMGHDPIHVLVVSLLTELAVKVNCDRHHLKIQLPIECPPDGAPEPDGAIVRGAARDYAGRLPSAADTSCVIEVAHSSLPRDRGEKLGIYAAAGIGQYILINLQNNTVEVYTEPDRIGERYQATRIIARGQKLSIQLPDGILEIDAGQVLP
jgi:Uma2 family endonuclease